MTYRIKYNVSPPSKIFEVNTDEELYFEKLSSKLTDEENKHIVLRRMSDGTLEPYFKDYPLGKVKLQGRKHYLQILKSTYRFDVVEGTVQDFIKRLDDVVLYIRKHCYK